MSRSATDQAIIDELLRRLAAKDEQARAKRQANVAAIRKKLGITHRRPPKALQRKPRLESLDLLYPQRAKMQQLRRKAHKEPLPEAGWWAWGDLQKGPTGRPENFADLALIKLAGNVPPEIAKRSFRAALAYLVLLLESDVPEHRARRRALACPMQLTDDERNRVKALERHAQRIKKRRTTQSG